VSDGALPGYDLAYQGKVRDLHVPAGATLETADVILMVASDRVSAFDHALEPPVPGKGATLTAMTTWWLRTLGDEAQLAGDHGPGGDALARIPDAVAGRALLVRSLDMLPVECVVRGRITGSGLVEYRETGAISGVALPAGLQDGDALPEPIFTPAWKAPKGQHDENIPFARVVELVGADAAETLRSRSLEVFARGAEIAASKGLVLADTKLEFGRDASGAIVLADEVLTSDSSRYWDAEALEAGRVESFDKQIVRDWLLAEAEADRWDRSGVPPVLPAAIVERTAARYAELLTRLTA
jgi:phosphoribosylaminoimidazole-succinocarboxamide synthase